MLSVAPEDRPSADKMMLYFKQLPQYAVKYDNEGRYEGYVVDDKYHGEGVHYRSDGTRIEGTWANGKHHGNYKYYRTNGDILEGVRMVVFKNVL
jgi:hypothetical protein